MSKKQKKIFIAIITYILLLILGIAAIMAFQYKDHIHIKDKASSVAQLINTGSEISFQGNVGVYLYHIDDSITVIKSDNDHSFIDFNHYFSHKDKDYIKNDYEYFFALDFNPITIAAIATAPIYDNSTLSGTLYVIRPITYLPAIIITFAVLYTILFLIVIGIIYYVHRSNEKINSIYRSYLANVSHELKSPIASIQAITETLSEGIITEEETISRYYGIIRYEAKHLEHSVEEIIELSKLQDRRIDFTKSPISAEKLFSPIEKIYSSRCEDYGISFIFDSSVYNLPELLTNEIQIRKLLESILENAVKFTPADGTINVWAEKLPAFSKIYIRDTGCGIPAKDIPHIFERFYKSSDPNNYSGSGLGLSIAKEIADGLGEKITVSSTPGEGSVFTITVGLNK